MRWPPNGSVSATAERLSSGAQHSTRLGASAPKTASTPVPNRPTTRSRMRARAVRDVLARVCREAVRWSGRGRVVLYGARLLPRGVSCMQSGDSTGRGKRASSPTRCNQQRPPPTPPMRAGLARRAGELSARRRLGSRACALAVPTGATPGLWGYATATG